MAVRRRSAGALLLVGFAALSLTYGPAFIASQSPASLRGTNSAQAAAVSAPAAYAVLLANAPAPAHAGGMFDFGLTLPFVAITFLLMMVTLNALWYGPVLEEQDGRNAKLLQTLSEATDNLAEADTIQTDYTARIREAREKASAAVAAYRASTEQGITDQMESAKKDRDTKVTEVKKKLDADIQQKIATAEAQIVARKEAFVKKTLESIGA